MVASSSVRPRRRLAGALPAANQATCARTAAVPRPTLPATRAPRPHPPPRPPWRPPARPAPHPARPRPGPSGPARPRPRPAPRRARLLPCPPVPVRTPPVHEGSPIRPRPSPPATTDATRLRVSQGQAWMAAVLPVRRPVRQSQGRPVGQSRGRAPAPGRRSPAPSPICAAPPGAARFARRSRDGRQARDRSAKPCRANVAVTVLRHVASLAARQAAGRAASPQWRRARPCPASQRPTGCPRAPRQAPPAAPGRDWRAWRLARRAGPAGG